MNDELQPSKLKKRINRRGLIKGASLTAVAAAGAAGVNSLNSKPVNAEFSALGKEEGTVEDRKEDFLFEISSTLEVPKEFHASPEGARGARRMVKITDGSFAGPKLKGKVLPGGHYWLVIRPDDAVELDGRTVLQTDDGHMIYKSYQGIVHAPPAIIQRLRRGESNIDPSEYYYRTSVSFETGAEKYDWLNQIVAVGIGRRTSTGVSYRVYVS